MRRFRVGPVNWSISGDAEVTWFKSLLSVPLAIEQTDKPNIGECEVLCEKGC